MYKLCQIEPLDYYFIESVGSRNYYMVYRGASVHRPNDMFATVESELGSSVQPLFSTRLDGSHVYSGAAHRDHANLATDAPTPDLIVQFDVDGDRANGGLK